MIEMLKAAKAAKPEIARLSETQKNAALNAMADALIANTQQILSANAEDMEKAKGTVSTVMLDPTGGNHPVIIKGITDVIVVADGQEIPLGLGGFLDIGLLDTMKDLWVNFIGAVVFSTIGYFYVKGRGRGWFAKRFIPKVVDAIQEKISPDAEE